MPTTPDHVLTTHAGSLPRPPDLLQMMFDRGAGKPVDAAALEARIASAVQEIVRTQRDMGIDLVSDGEMSKTGFSTYIYERLTGFSGQGEFFATDVADFPELAMRLFATPTAALIVMPNCEGAIEPRDQAAVSRDIANFKAALGDDVSAGFLPAATPGQITFNFVNKFYPSHLAYLEAAAQAMQPEYEAIAAAGLTLQLDSPDLAMAGHSGTVGTDLTNLQEHIEQAIGVLNDATRAIPPEQMRLHVCWGNYAGPHHKDVPLRDIVRPILQTRAKAIYVEAANPRHEHEWEVWNEVALPPDKVLIIGAIDVLTNHVEHPRLIAQRIERFARIVGRERVIAGTDCGFGTFAGWSACDPKVAWLKLQTLVDGAREATQSLFGSAAATT
ncbi:MAG: cobalamin-independent methionine synthase II family protein [Chloroflexi bacterium]|nr:cobalamin-independent methionine synthase II family protein [Chloroflexota bacterium]